MATAMNTRTAPRPIPASRLDASPEPNTPLAMSARPPIPSRPAIHGVKRAKRPGGSTAPSCSAAIGGTRVARRAGARLASSVIAMPTPIATMTVRGFSGRPASGRPKPIASNRAFRALSIRKPHSRPTSEARKPITSASPSTLRSTCRLVAPSVRSSASSRERWATVIENVLKMMNAPTSTATPANASSAVPRNVLIWSAMFLVCSSAFCSPVCTLT